ncbi:helix-turn-helix domain-containing protein [Spirosoma endbachense]|uniref:Helix-turn-helix domain-containing protein n=1 Tax=Spirosoma endbachense TaxID=2666025 RepID=A0A6P1W006_9BACT|nr:AraC family transcriptional regulator [Spirosoma endbachense]QHV97367.1 helix-turn-helix domain-containing protein [Spirosoma endbachense]
MTNVYDFLKYQPDIYRQFACKDLLFAYYDCPQSQHRDDIFSHHSYLSFVVSGSKRIYRQGKSWTFAKGSLEFVKKGGFIQEVYLDEGFRALTCYIPDTYLQQLIRSFRQFYRGKPITNQPTEPIIELAVNETTTGFVQTLLNYFEQEIEPTGEVLEERFRELLFTLLINPDNYALVTYLNSLTDRPRISLYEVLEANYMYHLSLNEYAQIANRSLASFKREFRSLFNTTPAQWLIQKRLDYALILLRTTEKSIGDIVFDSGFENGSHFSRVFKDKFGLSPQHYRKQRIGPTERTLTA